MGGPGGRPRREPLWAGRRSGGCAVLEGARPSSLARPTPPAKRRRARLEGGRGGRRRQGFLEVQPPDSHPEESASGRTGTLHLASGPQRASNQSCDLHFPHIQNAHTGRPSWPASRLPPTTGVDVPSLASRWQRLLPLWPLSPRHKFWSCSRLGIPRPSEGPLHVHSAGPAAPTPPCNVAGGAHPAESSLEKAPNP